MFNWLTVLVLMPLEATTGYLRHTTDALMSLKEWKSQGKSSGAPDLLKVVTRPFTESIVRVSFVLSPPRSVPLLLFSH